jgi:hypothetical protein
MYLAVGISSVNQHLVGMGAKKTIVAIEQSCKCADLRSGPYRQGGSEPCWPDNSIGRPSAGWPDPKSVTDMPSLCPRCLFSRTRRSRNRPRRSLAHVPKQRNAAVPAPPVLASRRCPRSTKPHDRVREGRCLTLAAVPAVGRREPPRGIAGSSSRTVTVCLHGRF